ncbi:MAG TPA: bifunctional glutamate N-acetyltransferase/amino-acid acetyltransferase ArgJ [Dehalococcoidia bacterium]|nr:bifunctional glutamate N-acetyltransferase/amino-acid acetyltransferase ArgJ [Dehalococcoidia bacterium]
MTNTKTFTIETITGGHLTTPKGFVAGAVCAGMYAGGPKAGQLDLGILFSERECAAAGVLTKNLVRAAPVYVDEKRLPAGRLRGVITNSGNANAPFGDAGIDDAEEMAALAARKLGVPDDEFAVCSTGVTGVLLPMEKIRAAVPKIELSANGGSDFARAIMTTDTVVKEAAVAVKDGDTVLYTLGGCCKGSGMIHPNMATMLAYITTDAAVDRDLLREAVRETADATFNMVTVDGDTSCSDTLLVFANGAAGGTTIAAGTPEAQTFREALLAVATQLARAIARDGEGASHLITVDVSGASSVDDARNVAKTVALSSLVKTAVAGADPNWGRILVAAGRAGSPLDPVKTTVRLQGELLFDRGKVIGFDERAVSDKLLAEEVRIEIDLGLGSGAATAWGCDLTTEYVHINADYRT